MAKFLSTSETNYVLEELIKDTESQLILISPFLKLNDRIKELLEDKNRFKIDIRIIYGKNELQNDEINWLDKLKYVTISFCKNLHAKCYLNEKSCIITSLNLYEFSQVNNNEMGVSISSIEDKKLYDDTYKEAQRIIRISDDVRISLDKIKPKSKVDVEEKTSNTSKSSTLKPNHSKLTTAKLATKLGITTKKLEEKLIKNVYIKIENGKEGLTQKGKEAGGEVKQGKYGDFFIWKKDFIAQ